MTIEAAKSSIDKALATLKSRHPDVDIVLATPEDWYAAIQADDSEVHTVSLGIGFRGAVEKQYQDRILGELQELLGNPLLVIVPYPLRHA